MATTAPDQPGEFISERIAGGMLPRVLNTFDMVAIFVSIVLFITNAAVIQSAGPAAFGWWIIGFLAFLIPGAIVTGQLGRMFPGEGSIYLWTQKAFGPFWGFFAGFCAWWPGRARNGGDRGRWCLATWATCSRRRSGRPAFRCRVWSSSASSSCRQWWPTNGSD